jgi:hypothetical protein
MALLKMKVYHSATLMNIYAENKLMLNYFNDEIDIAMHINFYLLTHQVPSVYAYVCNVIVLAKCSRFYNNYYTLLLFLLTKIQCWVVT